MTQERFTSEWLPVHPVDQKKKSVYLVIGSDNQPVYLEGWLRFPAGTKNIRIAICTDNEIENSENIRNFLTSYKSREYKQV